MKNYFISYTNERLSNISLIPFSCEHQCWWITIVESVINTLLSHQLKTDLWILHLLMHTGVQQYFHIRWYSCQLQVMEKELLTLPEHQSSPPMFSGVRVARSLIFCVVLCRSLHVILSFFIWSLHYLSFFDLKLLSISLVHVSSTFSF